MIFLSGTFSLYHFSCLKYWVSVHVYMCTRRVCTRIMCCVLMCMQLRWSVKAYKQVCNYDILILERLIFAYLLLQVNCDIMMHNCTFAEILMYQMHEPAEWVHWTSTKYRTGSALFRHNSRAQSKYTLINLIHTQHKCLFDR